MIIPLIDKNNIKTIEELQVEFDNGQLPTGRRPMTMQEIDLQKPSHYVEDSELIEEWYRTS